MILKKETVNKFNEVLLSPEARLIYCSLAPIFRKRKNNFSVPIQDFCVLTGMDEQSCGWKLKELRSKGIIGYYVIYYGIVSFKNKTNDSYASRAKQLVGGAL